MMKDRVGEAKADQTWAVVSFVLIAASCGDDQLKAAPEVTPPKPEPTCSDTHSCPTGRILGRVCDRDAGVWIAGATATMTVEGVLRSSVSDVAGQFVFEAVPPGSYLVHVESDAYVNDFWATVVAGQTVEIGVSTCESTCSYTEVAFDIEEVSVLEASVGWSGRHDAVVLNYDTSGLAQGSTWRPIQVDVLATIPQAEFASDLADYTVGVEIFDTDHPEPTRRYTIWQTLNKAALSWTPVTLMDPETSTQTDYQQAWWPFYFDAAIPESGMTSSTYLAGVVWPDSNDVLAVGYSNYDRPCNKNWTDYGLGWELNDTSERDECNWPMLRVNVEISTPSAGGCNP